LVTRFLKGYALYLKNVGRAFYTFLDDGIGDALFRADQLVWALLGGHPSVTISLGVGHWVLNRRPLGKILRPLVDLVARLWDGPSHALRTRLRHKVQPPSGAGFIYAIITAFLAFLTLSLVCSGLE
jgi:hypothetical protein